MLRSDSGQGSVTVAAAEATGAPEPPEKGSATAAAAEATGAPEPPEKGSATAAAAEATGAPEPPESHTDHHGGKRHRRVEWALVVVAFVIAVPLWLHRGTGFEKGASVEVDLVLPKLHQSELRCARQDSIGSYRCAFAAPGTPAPATGTEKILVPFKTMDHQLLLIPGLFALPQVRQLYRPGNESRLRQRASSHFRVRCDLLLIGEVADAHVQWRRHSPWGPPEHAWVGEVRHCKTVP